MIFDFNFLFENPLILQSLTFVLLLLSVVTIAKGLFYQLVYAFAPESKSVRFVMKPRLVRIGIAIADILAWGLGVIISCSVYKFSAITEILMSIFITILNLLLLLNILILLIYFCSSNCNQLIVSILGYWYLSYYKEILDRYHYFKLGNGEEGEIEKINFLHTTFRLKKDGHILIRNNSFLMYEIFDFPKGIGIEGLIKLINWWLIKSQRSNTDLESQSQAISKFDDSWNDTEN